jgi:hypothetical protein
MANPAGPVANQVHQEYRNPPRPFVKKWAAEEEAIHRAFAGAVRHAGNGCARSPEYDGNWRDSADFVLNAPYSWAISS